MWTTFISDQKLDQSSKITHPHKTWPQLFQCFYLNKKEPNPIILFPFHSRRFRDTSFLFSFDYSFQILLLLDEIECTPNNAFISIYAYILHPSGCYSIASQWNMKILKEIGLLIGVDRVHCLDFIDELMSKMNRRKKGFSVLFKGADIERLSIHWVSQSYYYFAIILTLIPFREPVSQPQHRRFTIHEVTLWWIWTIQPGRTRIQKKKRVSSYCEKFDYLWFWSIENVSTISSWSQSPLIVYWWHLENDGNKNIFFKKHKKNNESNPI